MDFFSLICNVCGTPNRVGQARCLTCGYQLAASNNAPAFNPVPANTLLQQRYRVTHAVGKGGMGIVYIGNDLQLGNRLVAIKEMRQRGLSQQEKGEVARNFQREAHLLAGLQHPNLPSIYDHFEEEQRWYLVMSFIQGQTLAAYLASRGGRLPVAEVLEIGIVLCSVLSYLHAHHPPIIFRDLKPSNIMRTPDGHIYLIDFGIARLFKPGKTRDTNDYGSHGYAPPEQYGNAQTTPRSDIYSLGATLYQMFSGYDPANAPFRFPPLQAQFPAVPVPIAVLITQMLDLDELKRPQSVDIVKRDLQKIAHTLNSTLPLAVPVKKQNRYRRRLLIPALLVVIIMVVALYDLIAFTHVTAPKTSVASVRKISTRLAGATASVVSRTGEAAAVTTFCNAMNAQPPDFSSAYDQLSDNYQHVHSLQSFRSDFLETTRCAVVNLPNAKNQARLNFTLFCPFGPPRNGPPPNGPPPPDGSPPPNNPPPGGPPPNRPPPLAASLVYLTLVNNGSRGWKIDTIDIAGPGCHQS